MNPDPTSLDRLHDVIVPPPVPWWPPAPGWCWLALILLAWTIYLAARAFMHWQHNLYRRQALAEWRRQSRLLADENSRPAALANLATLLKRAALSAYSRPQVASLTGSAWLAFLDRTAGMHEFSSDAGSLLEQAAYGVISPMEVDAARAQEVAALVRRWITTHRTEGST